MVASDRGHETTSSTALPSRLGQLIAGGELDGPAKCKLGIAKQPLLPVIQKSAALEELGPGPRFALSRIQNGHVELTNRTLCILLSIP